MSNNPWCIRHRTEHCFCTSCAPPTPEKGERMPDTKEHWEKFTAMQDELIMEQKAEISRLAQQVGRLRKKLGWPSN